MAVEKWEGFWDIAPQSSDRPVGAQPEGHVRYLELAALVAGRKNFIRGACRARRRCARRARREPLLRAALTSGFILRLPDRETVSLHSLPQRVTPNVYD
jgi:hypothetical protein